MTTTKMTLKTKPRLRSSPHYQVHLHQWHRISISFNIQSFIDLSKWRNLVISTRLSKSLESEVCIFLN